jgi:hypothetical protein
MKLKAIIQDNSDFLYPSINHASYIAKKIALNQFLMDYDELCLMLDTLH